MKNNKMLYVILIFAGIGLFCIGGFVLTEDSVQSLSAVCIGVGAGVFGMSFGQLIKVHLESKDPQLMRKQRIEAKDERNQMLNHQAKAKAFDFMQIIFSFLMIVYVLLDVELIVTLLAVAVFLLGHIVYMVSLGKYAREL